MSTVAVVGLGGMGSRIARRFLDGGHELVVWNRDPAKAMPLTDFGAAAAVSPAEAARQAEAVVIMVADPPALQAVTEGPDGIAAGAGEDTTVVQMSTVGPRSIARRDGAPGLAGARKPERGRVGEPEDLRRRF
jgi:3-hydroxyisobutyrate dehydrogenase-like beta-hydroxyacid dehydrogenase